MSELPVPDLAPVNRGPLDRSMMIGLIVLGLLAIMPLLSPILGGDYMLSLVIKAMIFAIAAISLDLVLGYGGMVSFGHAVFLGIGAYVTGIALQEGVYGAFPILALVLLISGAFALITGAISLRTTGVYFIMITLAFAQMVYFSLTSLSYYGGDDGLTLWDTPEVFGMYLFQTGSGLFYSTLVLLALIWFFVWRLAMSRFGRVLRAAKQNPTRVGSLGYNVFVYRLIAYVISGMLAGVAGFLLACQAEFISPSTTSWQISGHLIIMVVLGGLATRNGPLLGALFVVLIEEILSQITHDWRLIFGPLLVLIVLFSKGGLAGLLKNKRATG
ncbi:branched-chain amino acid ABC transporter permease [uncultured Ruegeria sp.]|uniref:branched-chain amino acid ABC transporter permease n=1 Tax=uncultured Ruegeria sp. TaxID=259304 RepID=UPI0026211A4C|nr:branched-chain amino acid ABC transporter permease [uncultured Ruegeria sp.]